MRGSEGPKRQYCFQHPRPTSLPAVGGWGRRRQGHLLEGGEGARAVEGGRGRFPGRRERVWRFPRVPPRQMGPGLFVPGPQPPQGQMSPRGRGQGSRGRGQTSTPPQEGLRGSPRPRGATGRSRGSPGGVGPTGGSRLCLLCFPSLQAHPRLPLLSLPSLNLCPSSPRSLPPPLFSPPLTPFPELCLPSEMPPAQECWKALSGALGPLSSPPNNQTAPPHSQAAPEQNGLF